jgi:hypothetical protein
VPIKQVLYISRSAPSVTELDVRKILFASQRNNRRHDITGCLLYSGRHFVQVLEGLPAALDLVLARIAADPRHDRVRVVAERETLTRRYPHWSMGILFKLDLADHVEALLEGEQCAPERVESLLAQVVPDTVAGAL